MILVFDTETTGLPDWKRPPSAGQPGLVQLAAALFSENGKEQAAINLLVKPRHPIQTKAYATHGISELICAEFGVSEKMAVAVFDCLSNTATAIVAHNADFDWLILESARAAAGLTEHPRRAERAKLYCTMDAASPITQLPPTERMKQYGFGDKFKNPTLSETYAYLFKEQFTGAHDALNDVRACARVFFELRRRNQPDGEAGRQYDAAADCEQAAV